MYIMNKKIIVFLLIITPFLNSCISSFKTIHNAKIDNLENGLIYALPSTKLTIKIEIIEIQKQKGPFYEFLNLYFDSEAGIKNNELSYQISDISIETSPIADTENIYTVIPSGKTAAGMLNITPEGFLAGINLNDYQAEKVQIEHKILSEKISESNNLNYGDFSLNSITETRYDTLYKEVMIDSVMVKVPVITKKDVIKSNAKRAKETADILFMLRDDRNALLKGENDGTNFPDGEALKIMISELNNLEKQYMSLFTGRITKIPKSYTFEIIPQKDSTKNRIFRFSEETGISDPQNGLPVILILKSENLYNQPNSINRQSVIIESKSDKAYKGLIYRIPVKTNCEIFLQSELLYKKPVLISQNGVLNLIPKSIFKENTSVEFYPETGSLKRISKIK